MFVCHRKKYVDILLAGIRFPMMTPSQLAGLTLGSLAETHVDALVARIREGMRYHNNFDDVANSATSDKKFTPRLYTSDEFSAYLCIDNLSSVQSYHCRSLVFATQKHSADCKKDSGQAEWTVDVYPKGCFYI